MHSEKKIIESSKIKIGTYLFKHIKDRNLTIEGIALSSGMSKRTIYNILQGKGYTIDSLINLLITLDFLSENRNITSFLDNINFIK